MTDRVTEEEFQAARNAFADADWYRNGFDAALRAAISSVKPKSEWKTIDDNAPKDGTHILLYEGNTSKIRELYI